MDGDIVLATQTVEMLFWAFDQWNGVPEMLAAFVTPNYPRLAPIIARASEHMKEWTGSSAFTGYQTGDPHIARLQAAALYKAIREEGIVYVGAPASFDAGQRIRMVDNVLDARAATCLDFSILYASCLEAVDLRPLIMLIPGHAFVGVWLEEQSFPETIEEDYAGISKRCSRGVEKMTVIQATDMARDSKVDFEEAEMTARSFLHEPFVCAVDIHRARASQIIPLPIRMYGDGSWKVDLAPEEHIHAVAAPKRSEISTLIASGDDPKPTKKQLWERSLLDLSMRNNLLNMRLGVRAMPLLAVSLDEIEDMLSQDKELEIMPKPEELPIPEGEAFQIIGVGEESEKLFRSELEEGRIRTAFTASVLKKTMDGLFRSAKSSLEESGANTLFLTLGTLKWVDEKRGGQTRFAPIILLPVDIVRKSAKSGYRIRLRDDEPQINISLLELLRTEFGISITGLDPLPHDEAGVDTRLVFNTFTQKIMDQTGWEVLEAATLGLFSFSQFVMWSDIRNREADLRKSKLVESMMEGHLTWAPEPVEEDALIDPTGLLMPVEMDASQMLAVREALAGKSLVLHGPPGTGKSQTITAIIANALAHGKRVLFVAEKMAALEVVERRMARMGLGPFCLEVHSTKATKNHVLEQIQEAVELEGATPVKAFAAKADEVAALRKRLDAYAKGLSTENAAGISLREQICRFDSLNARFNPLYIDYDFISSLTSPQDFAHRMNTAERLIAMAKTVTPISDHPLKSVVGAVYSPRISMQISQTLKRMREAAASYIQSAISAQSFIEVEKFDAGLLRDTIEYARNASIAAIPELWDEIPDLNFLKGRVNSVLDAYRAFGEHRSALEKRYEASFFLMSPSELEQEWIDANSRGFFGKGKALSGLAAKLSLVSKAPVDKDDIESCIKDLKAFKQEGDSLKALERGLYAELGSFISPDGSIDLENVRQTISEAENMRFFAAKVGLDLRGLRKACSDEGRSTLEALQASRIEFNNAESEVNELIGGIDFPRQDANWPDRLREACDAIEQNVDKLRAWMNWREASRLADELGLAPLVAYLSENPWSEEIFDSFQCGIYKSMCMVSFESVEEMRGFSGVRFDQVVRQYARADKQLRDLAKDEIFYRIASHLPNLTAESAMNPRAGKLARALRSRGRNVSIRSLFHEASDMVLSFCPCVLMSPLSVAQYLEPGDEQFDLLIFDEASQLQTCKAVGALSRAKAAIIVGDPNQMPPTSFFKGAVTGEDYEEVADLESVLEDCLAINLPQTYLKWHYRSQHESLIAFSNKRFYENKLFTFPSADDGVSHVVLKKVDGVFERGGRRVNQREAEAIVADLKRRAKDPAIQNQSVGVVTFNIPQQTLIEDLFQKACEEDATLYEWANRENEPLFIKNLENVQGDERDVILFSVTYAYDKTGKMSMNFGPINREGGWRRLNVAVTRARSDMAVFSSIDSTDIDCTRISSMGPVALRDFLEFAQRGSFGSISLSEVAQDSRSDQIACDIMKRLEGMGYETRLNVGKSSYRVDIGVVDPYSRGRYLAGILLDGESYLHAGSTRDREVAQVALLERLGWHVLRIWSVEWYEDSEGVMGRLVEFLENAKAEAALSVESNGECAEVLSRDVVSSESPHVASGVIEEASPFTESLEAVIGELAQDVEAPIRKPLEPSSRGFSAQTDLDNEESDYSEETDSDRHGEPLQLSKADSAYCTPQENWRPASAFSNEEPSAEKREGYPNPSCDAASSVNAPGKSTYMVAHLEMHSVGPQEFMCLDSDVICDALQRVIALEAPLEKTVLFRRVAQAFGVARIGSRIQDKIEVGFKKVSCKRISQAGRTMVWRKDQDPKRYFHYRVPASDDEKRASDSLPLEEIAAAAFDALRMNGPMRQDDLVKAASLIFGYKRAASSILEYFKKGISFGLRRKWLSKEGPLYRVGEGFEVWPEIDQREEGGDAAADDSIACDECNMRYAFFDVETPNRRNASICQMGIVITDSQGIVINERSFLVDPEEAFDLHNVEVHGIRQKDVMGAPTFASLWRDELLDMLDGAQWVSHNARFDLSVLGKCFARYGIEPPRMFYACTMELSSLLLPNLQSRSLPSVCDELHIDFGHHHDALDDARACKDIFWEMAARFGKANMAFVSYEWQRQSEFVSDDLAVQCCDGAMLELYGIMMGISADGAIREKEIEACQEWLAKNAQYRTTPFFRDVVPILEGALSDDRITEEEYEEILNVLRPFSWQGGGATESQAARALMGLLRGVSADGIITVDEASLVSDWMKENGYLKTSSAYGALFRLLEDALEDGILDGEEQKALFEEMRKLLNPVAKITNAMEVANNVFCLSGDFEHGSKSEIEKDIERCGGVIAKSVTRKCSYVVIGSLGSERYKFGDYGTKVTKAMELQDKGFCIRVITESQLFEMLNG